MSTTNKLKTLIMVIMKKNNFLSKALLLGVFCLPMVFTACSDNDEVDSGESSRVKIVNASEASTPQDFYLNDRKVNSSAIAYRASSEGYVTTKSGNDQEAEFRTSGSVTASSEVDLKGDKNYTFFLHGQGTATRILTTEDDLTAPAEGKAKIRFAHLSAAANQGVDLNIGGAELRSGLHANSTTGCLPIDGGLHHLSVLAAGSNSNPIELNLSALGAGSLYTVVISGSSNVSATLFTDN